MVRVTPPQGILVQGFTTSANGLSWLRPGSHTLEPNGRLGPPSGRAGIGAGNIAANGDRSPGIETALKGPQTTLKLQPPAKNPGRT